MKNLNDLFQYTVQDMYSSEKLLLKGMADMAKAAQSPRLREAINKHIAQTQEHVHRLERIAGDLGFNPDGETCQATVGIVKEAAEHINEFGNSPAGDAAIIACAQKAEHYEIGNYGTAIAWAEILGYEDAVDAFQKTLGEEEDADETLTNLAESDINEAATQGQSGGRAVAL